METPFVTQEDEDPLGQIGSDRVDGYAMQVEESSGTPIGGQPTTAKR